MLISEGRGQSANAYSVFLSVILSAAKDLREAMPLLYGFAKLCIGAIPYIDRLLAISVIRAW